MIAAVLHSHWKSSSPYIFDPILGHATMESPITCCKTINTPFGRLRRLTEGPNLLLCNILKCSPDSVLTDTPGEFPQLVAPPRSAYDKRYIVCWANRMSPPETKWRLQPE